MPPKLHKPTNRTLAENRKAKYNYFIENEQTHIPITGFNAVKRKTETHQKAHIGGFDISQLPSGNYNLVIQLLNRKGKNIIHERLFFQRRNTKIILKPQDYASLNSEGSFVDKFTIIEEMAENISSLFPIANVRERSYAANQLTTWDLEQMKKQLNKTNFKNSVITLDINEFLDPKIKDIKLAKYFFNSDCVEIHTGKICNLINQKKIIVMNFLKLKKHPFMHPHLAWKCMLVMD